MAGYQRSLNEQRSKALANYLKLSPANLVPGAIIVAVDEDYLSIRPKEPFTELTVRDDERDFDTKLQELFGGFTTRMSNEELQSADISFTADDWDDSANGDIDGEYPKSYLATLAKELQQAVLDWSSVPEERQRAIKEYIGGVSKPGLIIDGQHRVFGAAGVEDIDVVLPVVILPGLAYAEQVFQFWVLNSKAKPLKPTELRRIVSTTLTDSEIEGLYSRFKQAGIAADEARWTQAMNSRPDSPFRNRIDFGYSERGAIIKENVADQLVGAFMRMPYKKYGSLIKPLGETWTNDDDRLELFFWFWRAIKNKYATAWANAEAAASEGKLHNLFSKVALLTLQKFVLDRFLTAVPFRGDAPPPFSSETEVLNMVANALKTLPGEFFDREWKTKQIDTSDGRKELYGAMEHVWNNQGGIHGNMKLFKG